MDKDSSFNSNLMSLTSDPDVHTLDQQGRRRQHLHSSPKSSSHTYHDALGRLTVHGITDVCETKAMKWRIIWIMVLVIACLLLCIEIARTIVNYKNSPITTTYSIMPSLNERPFPKIYLCPLNVIHSRKLMEQPRIRRDTSLFRLKKFFQLGASLMSSKDHYLAQINTNYDVIQYTQPINPKMRSGLSSQVIQIPELVDDHSLDISDFVRECSFERQSINCLNSTRKVFDGNRGQCYIIDVKKPQEVAAYGLNVVLDIRRDLYHDQLLPKFDGVLLSIIDDYSPGGVLSQTLLEPGGWTKVSLKSRHYELLNIRSNVLYQPCYESHTWQYDTLNYSKYSRESCRLDCAQNLSLSHCDCLLPIEQMFLSKNISKHVTFCHEDVLQECFYNRVIKKHQLELATCVEKCLNPCNYWQHSIGSMSRVGFSSVGGNNKMDNNSDDCIQPFKGPVSDRKCSDDVIILDIGYSDLMYSKITQSPSMTIDTFISNIGGQVGLWMGVSVISMVQVFTLIVLYCKDKFHR